MKAVSPFLFCCLAWSFFHITGCNAGDTQNTNEAERLLQLERQAITREFANDTAFLSSIMDSTFIELSRKGLKNKYEVLRTIYQNNIQNLEDSISLDSFLLEEPVVHLYENSAVVSFIMHTFRKKQDSAFERRTRFYDVWVKRSGEWKAVTWQASEVD